MKKHPEDIEDVVWISIPLSGETASRLKDLSNFCNSQPEKIASSLLHDILEDDESMNVVRGETARMILN